MRDLEASIKSIETMHKDCLRLNMSEFGSIFIENLLLNKDHLEKEYGIAKVKDNGKAVYRKIKQKELIIK